MNESRQSKIEEIRKKSLETLREARLAEQEKNRLDSRFSLNEKVSGAAAGAAGGAAGGGAGNASTRLTSPLEGITNSRYQYGIVPLAGDLIVLESWSSVPNRAMNFIPNTKLGESISETNRELTPDGNPSSVPSVNDEAPATFWRQKRDSYFKAANEAKLAKMDGAMLLNRKKTYEYTDYQGNVIEQYNDLTFEEALRYEVYPDRSITMANPGDLLEVVDAKGAKKSYPQGNILYPISIAEVNTYAGPDLGLYESFGYRGGFVFHETPVIFNANKANVELDELRAKAEEAGEEPNALTLADTDEYKAARFPQIQNLPENYGDVCRTFDGPFPSKGESYEGDTEQYTWKPAFELTAKDNRKYKIVGQWVEVSRLSKEKVLEWNGNTITQTIEFEDILTEFRASRDAYLKGLNEATLSAGPAYLSAKYGLANVESNYANTGVYRKPEEA